MKTLIPKDLKMIKETSIYVDAFILPLEDLSTNYPNTFSIKQIAIAKNENKEIFVCINKNIHNDEIKKLEDSLKQIEKLKINGIIFYDIAIVNLKNKLNLKTPLVWHQEHLTTNYGTINYWYQKGCKYAYLSSELTKEEIGEIIKKSKAKLFVNIFGYVPMFTSKRNLITNYLKYFSLKDNKGNKKIYKENKFYPIIEKDGTTVLSNYILNIKEEIKADYLVYNSYLIDDIIEVLKGNNKYKEENGFLYQKTFYKVKEK